MRPRPPSHFYMPIIKVDLYLTRSRLSYWEIFLRYIYPSAGHHGLSELVHSTHSLFQEYISFYVILLQARQTLGYQIPTIYGSFLVVFGSIPLNFFFSLYRRGTRRLSLNYFSQCFLNVQMDLPIYVRHLNGSENGSFSFWLLRWLGH